MAIPGGLWTELWPPDLLSGSWSQEGCPRTLSSFLFYHIVNDGLFLHAISMGLSGQSGHKIHVPLRSTYSYPSYLEWDGFGSGRALGFGLVF